MVAFKFYSEKSVKFSSQENSTVLGFGNKNWAYDEIFNHPRILRAKILFGIPGISSRSPPTKSVGGSKFHQKAHFHTISHADSFSQIRNFHIFSKQSFTPTKALRMS